MTDNYYQPAFIEINDLNIFNLIKAKLNPQSYIECKTCGSVKVDSPDLAAALYETITILSKKDATDDFDELHDALFGIVEIEPFFDDVDEWLQWYKNNEHRVWDYPHRYDEILYLTCSEAIFYHDASCECIKLHEKAYPIEE